jgi:hypothetical protein
MLAVGPDGSYHLTGLGRGQVQQRLYQVAVNEARRGVDVPFVFEAPP